MSKEKTLPETELPTHELEEGTPKEMQETADMYQPAALNHNDIINAEQIIAAAMERGAFKARELVQVSAVYARLAAFVETIPADQRGSQNGI